MDSVLIIILTLFLAAVLAEVASLVLNRLSNSRAGSSSHGGVCVRHKQLPTNTGEADWKGVKWVSEVRHEHRAET